ncbi:hypothetical protein TeGR_g8843 [Tetraparma gracilis]|uniref:Protein kinase domain-containing protein n=1 Tax=Tetraparma gracilis TaxID=2962635 RepID=A0ABQ6MR00_9STRA|nr:hypothetical protein TeGR_g8843 [Tetraparma gracilis]
MASDIFLYHAEAAYVAEDNGASVTIPCDVLYDENVPPAAALSVSCELTLATQYKVSIFNSHKNPQLLGGTEHELTIGPAETDPGSCVVELPSSKNIVAGSRFEAVVLPFDEFKNPTSHAEDTFESRVELGSSGATVGNRQVLPADHAFSEQQKIAGTYELYLYHYDNTQTGSEIAGSPISFDVVPAAADASSSTHNLGDTKSIVSNHNATITVQVFPRDAYGNKIVTATGFKVKMTVRDQEQLSTLNPDEDYLGVIPIPGDLDATITFEFTLDGVLIGDGEVVEIVVAPPEVKSDHTNTYIAVGVSSFLLLVGAFFYRRRLQHAAKRLKSVELEMVNRNKDFSMREKALEAEKEELEEEVRLKKHSEEELLVMVSALEAVSKERQDELKEVMMESKELKIDKLLGKGGFGVANLATYRGTKVAMKQLLTVNEENVLRFRHECFLTKNLSHPNVVKLVGVCWSEELFACCLEFVENGSLEDWLRNTVGGKKYVATKKPVIGKGKNTKKPKKKMAPLTEVAFKGFDYHGKYNPAEVTETDKERKAEADALLHEWWMQRMNPKMGFEELLKEDKSRLDHGVSGYHAYDKESRCGRAIASCIINATPKQVMGLYADDRRTRANPNQDVIETAYTSSVGLLNVPIPIPTVSDRESLYRAVNIKDDAARSFSNVSYTIEDERRPPVSGKVRVDGLFLFVAREAPGSEGERSECFRMSRTNFKFAKGLGFVNALITAKAGETIAAPLAELKQDVERLVEAYEPPEHRVESFELTWKGGLWRMALEAALGVQYLHHHRYWSDGGKRHNGATNQVEEEQKGWKESVIHRDLKPDNMLLTRDWTLKLTDFGEARAQNMGGTMTSVGTPIYISPEVMRGDKYDEKADTWSYGLCLVAMIRAERTLEQFFYQALRKHKKRRTTKGLGMGQMAKYYYSEGWRPILPLAFVKAYPKLHALIQECWLVRR